MMPVFWVPKITMRAVIKIANYDAIKLLPVVIKTHHVAKTANLCQAALNVENRSTRPVNEKLVAPAPMPSVQSHRQWKMVPSVRNVANVAMENAVRSLFIDICLYIHY